MQDELRITFFVIGIVFIVGILMHGAWTIRKNKKQSKPNSFHVGRSYEPRFDSQHTENEDGFDPDREYDYDTVGVSQARVISTEKITHPDDKFSARDEHEDIEEVNDSNLANSINAESDFASSSENIVSSEDGLPESAEPVKVSVANDLSADTRINEDSENTPPSHAERQPPTNAADGAKSSAPLYSGVVTQPKPAFTKINKLADNEIDNNNDVTPEPPGFLLKRPTVISNQAEPVAKVAESSKDSDSLDKPEAKKEVTSDFSLNVQDGPVKPKPEFPQEQPIGVEKELSFAQQAKRFVTRRKKTVAEKIRKEPLVKANDKKNVDQMRIDFESTTASSTQDKRETSGNNEAVKRDENAGTQAQQTDVLVLNVRANAENPIAGAALLPMLLTLGFKFGEHDIFHRHVNTNGKGPILFSLTNMFKPGVFDIDNIENFSTQGVSLFMMLPIEGEAQQVFNMMHNAARKISEEFDCKILDGNKVLISKQSLQHYSERIREFERSRIHR